MSSTDLYLDLLVRCIANTIYGDSSQAPWDAPKFDAAAREDGRDWPSVAHSMIGVKRLENLRQLSENAIKAGVPGDFIETGVWRGGACILMRGVLAAYGEHSRKVIVADSFQGLPKPDEALYPADAGDTHHTFEQLAISETAVRSNFEVYGLLDEQVEFLKGWFCDTLPTLGERKFALIRLDGDMYQSTMDALVSLYPRLSVGGYAIIDDYGAIPACKRAVEDFRSREGITEPMEEVDWTGVWWRKAK